VSICSGQIVAAIQGQGKRGGGKGKKEKKKNATRKGGKEEKRGGKCLSPTLPKREREKRGRRSQHFPNCWGEKKGRKKEKERGGGKGNRIHREMDSSWGVF